MGTAFEHPLLVGMPGEHTGATGAGGRYAHVDSSDKVIVLPARLTEQLLADPLFFRDRNLVKVAEPTSATVERGLRKTTFARTDDTWKMTEPVEAEAEATELQAFVKDVSRLRADRVVAEKPADLKPYGLDRPQALWRFAAGGKEELSLAVGAFEPAGKGEKGPGRRAYARLGTGDLVFLLDDRLTAQALAEYRSRKVWPPLDAVQIEGLRYQGPQGGFALQKVNNTWQVAGKPAAKVNADAVRDTLDALARLQAERYMTDRGKDLKLFGLEPPTLTLEIDTTSGKRTLEVGRQEGGSARYYARVAGSADAPVFVLSEAESRKIVRPLSAFATGGGS
jgi:hypothetical protein